ncbi:MAG TPA: hypothetical protein VKI61_09085, partial [Chitinophagaceae bacterium]|nr:hypothetical protein [Chitinophagaceae bacterium]
IIKTQGSNKYQNIYCSLQDKEGNLWLAPLAKVFTVTMVTLYPIYNKGWFEATRVVSCILLQLNVF